MSNSIIVGPLLGYEEGDFYTVCILTEPMESPPSLEVSGKAKPLLFVKKANVGSHEFWRAEFKIRPAAAGTPIEYAVKRKRDTLTDRHGRNRWRFYVPGKKEEPRVVYASCNGFSSAKLARDTDEPYCLWARLAAQQHRSLAQEVDEPPFALLLMGGDQVYADEIWESRRCPELQRWTELSWKKQNAAAVSAAMRAEIEAFYDWLYLDRWKDEQMSLVLASIPSVMMWDDHDIFDGWGSYPEERQACDVFKTVFAQAARVFDLFQLRGSNRSRLNPAAAHRSLRLRFRDYHLLILDNRSERNLKQIMSEAHWTDVKDWLGKIGRTPIKNLLVMTGLPVVYRSFATVEKLFESTPWRESLEDDVQDHWSTTGHQAERMRLVMVLLNFLAAPAQSKTKGVLLSGDVHVGALGQIRDAQRQVGLTQVISSGIVHPPPTALAWLGLRLMTSDNPEPLGDGNIVAEMLTPFGSDRYLRNRNFVSFFTGTDDKIWVNWICEDEDIKPSFAIAGK
jgi:hypothetical protein